MRLTLDVQHTRKNYTRLNGEELHNVYGVTSHDMDDPTFAINLLPGPRLPLRMYFPHSSPTLFTFQFPRWLSSLLMSFLLQFYIFSFPSLFSLFIGLYFSRILIYFVFQELISPFMYYFCIFVDLFSHFPTHYLVLLFCSTFLIRCVLFHIPVLGLVILFLFYLNYFLVSLFTFLLFMIHFFLSAFYSFIYFLYSVSIICFSCFFFSYPYLLFSFIIYFLVSLFILFIYFRLSLCTI